MTAVATQTRGLLGAVIGSTHPLLCCSQSEGDPRAGASLGRLLERPPFGYLRAVVVEVIRATGFGAEALAGAALACASDKAARLRFLVRLIACVAFVDPRTYGRLLVTAIPSRLLVETDPLAAHELLQGLVHACCCSAEARRVAEEQVARIGDVALYERSVRLRAAIKRLQRRVRTYLSHQQQRQQQRRHQQQQQQQQRRRRRRQQLGHQQQQRKQTSAASITTIPTTEAPPAVDIKDLPMRLSTRRPLRENDQPLVLCLSTSTILPPRSCLPPAPLRTMSSDASTPIHDDGDGAADRPSCTEAGTGEEPHFKELISRSWRQVIGWISNTCLLSHTHKRTQSTQIDIDRARRRAEQQAEALAEAKSAMEADLKEAQQARVRLEETLQRTLVSKRRVEEALRKARERDHGGSRPVPAVAAAAAALETQDAPPAPPEANQEQEQEEQQRQSILEMELRQAATLIAGLQKRLRARREVRPTR